MTSRRWRVAAILAPIAITTAALATPAAAAQARTPASSPPLTLQCSPDFNGGTMVNGICVLPDATVGQQYEAFLATSNFTDGGFTIVSGSLPAGLIMPSTYGVTGTIIGGTPTTPGTFTFTVHADGSIGGVPEQAARTFSITAVR